MQLLFVIFLLLAHEHINIDVTKQRKFHMVLKTQRLMLFKLC